MGILDYKKLYELQDKVLHIVFETEYEFYLTGGTCLNRFYYEKRISNDLDFFTHNAARYAFAVRNINIALQKHFSLAVEVEAKDFIRWKVDNQLQIDFIHDRIPRYKEPVVHGSYLIDNIENILSNKLTAVLGRDNPKDIFDIYLIARFETFAWSDILDAAHEKAEFNDDDLLIRLKSFPVGLLQQIQLTDRTFLDNFESEFQQLIEEISRQTEHQKLDNHNPMRELDNEIGNRKALR